MRDLLPGSNEFFAPVGWSLEKFRIRLRELYQLN